MNHIENDITKKYKNNRWNYKHRGTFLEPNYVDKTIGFRMFRTHRPRFRGNQINIVTQRKESYRVRNENSRTWSQKCSYLATLDKWGKTHELLYLLGGEIFIGVVNIYNNKRYRRRTYDFEPPTYMFGKKDGLSIKGQFFDPYHRHHIVGRRNGTF